LEAKIETDERNPRRGVKETIMNPRPQVTQENFSELGVDDGTRTHDNRNHNPGLYQLSYAHHRH
jgi:hypothetical protein